MYLNDDASSVISTSADFARLKSNMAGESPDVFRESGRNAAFSSVLINQKKHAENHYAKLGEMVAISMSRGFERF